jgi:hypothetical protein
MNTVAHTHHRTNWTTRHRLHGRMAGTLGGNSTAPRRPPGSPLKPRTTNRLSTTRPTNSKSEVPALPLLNSQSAGFTGGHARGLGRSAFTEALSGKIGVSWIHAAKPDVNRLCDAPLGTGSPISSVHTPQSAKSPSPDEDVEMSSTWHSFRAGRSEGFCAVGGR